MSPEMKMRAWDDVAQRMVYSKTEQFDDMLGFRFDHFETENPVYMWCAGIPDKDKQDLYPGDVVQIDDTDEVSMWVRGEIAIVEHVPGRFRIHTVSGEKNMMQEVMSDVIKRIGNIYENPDLVTLFKHLERS